jgi:hypothetical protein
LDWARDYQVRELGVCCLTSHSIDAADPILNGKRNAGLLFLNYNRIGMTVKELIDLLDVQQYGGLPVQIRCRWSGEAPAHDLFDVKYATEELEPDTGEAVVTIECQQEP